MEFLVSGFGTPALSYWYWQVNWDRVVYIYNVYNWKSKMKGLSNKCRCSVCEQFVNSCNLCTSSWVDCYLLDKAYSFICCLIIMSLVVPWEGVDREVKGLRSGGGLPEIRPRPFKSLQWEKLFYLFRLCVTFKSEDNKSNHLIRLPWGWINSYSKILKMVPDQRACAIS